MLGNYTRYVGQLHVSSLGKVCYKLQKIVLPLLLRHLAKVDGVIGASVEAGKATRTMRLPDRNIIDDKDVADRTVLQASAARYAFSLVHIEILVRQKVTIKQRPDDIGLRPRERTSLQVANLLTFLDACHDVLHGIFLLRELLLTLLFAIHIEARQTDIDIGHQDRESRIELPSKSLLQYFISIAHIIATSHHGIYICLSPSGEQEGGHFLHHIRYTPTINWEYQAYHLIISRSVHSHGT